MRMSLPDEAVLFCGYALALVLVAGALPWGGTRIRHRLTGLAPGAAGDARAIYVGSSAILVLAAAALLLFVGMRHASPATILTIVGVGVVVAWSGRSTWKKWTAGS